MMATSQPPRQQEQDAEDTLDFPTTSLVWLPLPKTIKRKARAKLDVGWFRFLSLMRDNEFCMWRLIQGSLPPLLARKFHIVNVRELMKDEEDRHYMGVATWFVMWSQAFGLEHLNTLHHRYEELKKLRADKRETGSSMKKDLQLKQEQEKWKNVANETLRLMCEARKIETAPSVKDNAITATEFLLEPCIIIQLPWNNVLFHQWLTAALVEVLVFEKSSLELRHWPLLLELEPIASELLTLVKQLKERIVLGFAIMSQQVISHPNVETRHPGWIMDEVVLPSLATLQFLTTGKACTILKSIKKLAWSNHDQLVGRLYVSNCSYCMDKFLDDAFITLCYNLPFFHLEKNPSYPMAANICQGTDIEKVIQRIRSNETDIVPNVGKYQVLFDRKDISIFEDSLLEFLDQENLESIYFKSVDEMLNLTLNTMKELLVDTGRIPLEGFNSFEHYFSTSHNLKKTLESILQQKKEQRSQAIFIVQEVMLYWELRGYLIDSEKEKNVFARIVCLELEILEREQIIRLANMTTPFCETNPVAINLEKSPPMTIESMTQVLQEVHKKLESQTRDWLWTQFPAEWRKPVSLQEPALELSLGTSAIVKVCEERIGRMVYNVARESFRVFERGGDVFPHWQTVQYILPCFVASFVETVKQCEEVSSTNMLKFLDGILKFYELNFRNSLKKIKARQVVKLLKGECTAGVIHETNLLCHYYMDKISIMTIALVGLHIDSTTEGYYGFQEMSFSLSNWPTSTGCDDKTSLPVYNNCKIWSENCLNFFKNLYQIIVNNWDIPSHVKVYKRYIREIFIAESIVDVVASMSTISFMHHVAKRNKKINSDIAQLNVKIMKTQSDNKQSRCDLFSDVILFDGIRIADSAENSRTSSINLYKLLKMAYKKVRPIICNLALEHLPIEPPELKIAAKYYIEGNFAALDKMLDILFNKDYKSPEYNPTEPISDEKLREIWGIPEDFQSKKETSKKSTKKSKEKTEGPFEKCRNCPKTERKWGPFLVCEKCVEEKYPDVNYFCSKKCQEERWRAEHMAEHLEFELGLADFSHLNLK